MTHSFHPEAEREFEAAIDYYENCERGLGLDFAVEVFCSVDNILEHPAAWPILEDDVRRCLTNRFPYGVLYSVESDTILILAVMHLHQEPNYWKRRQ